MSDVVEFIAHMREFINDDGYVEVKFRLPVSYDVRTRMLLQSLFGENVKVTVERL